MMMGEKVPIWAERIDRQASNWHRRAQLSLERFLSNLSGLRLPPPQRTAEKTEDSILIAISFPSLEAKKKNFKIRLKRTSKVGNEKKQEGERTLIMLSAE